ncbi:uncharacterized protein [Takifugu rubripes]|uniref:uncharacterized protein n=1 Tax=Takifugu rubripes TaxID=31033 RepID=UPI001145E280|nr:uncharacterized protein LOC115246814 [Takifugu rubripes]XP_029682166.1 uncharacterized protein LOC115246814 [Takifugu rubripes]
MEFWPGNQGQSPLYSTFTVPGRNCPQTYHDRHRNPPYYGERQDQRREPTYWTLPGSRAALHDYAPWMEHEQVGLSSSHFPFILDHHPQHHQELGAYQPHETRDREWAQRASREYERGFPREGWPGRWETCSPARYSREVSVKRNDSSYRELEAWAARYSHSLQRRKRIEAELRGASHGLTESSRAPERDIRGGTTAPQQVVHPGRCDRAGRQQAHPLQGALADTGHPPKEKTCFQRRLFSKPPGYIAPPPYDTPQKSSSVSHQGDTSWEQEGKKQTYWSHPILKDQDMAVDHQTRKTERFTNPDVNQLTFCPQYSRPQTHSLQEDSAGYVQRPHVQFEGMMSLQQAPVLHTVRNKAEEPSSKIIEGRKFKLNKKAGRVTIFCLVSRIADSTEIPPSPVCGLQTTLGNMPGGEATGQSESETIQAQKLADEVDYRVPTFVEESEPSNTDINKQEEPASLAKTEKPETDVEVAKDADCTAGTQSSESGKYTSVKYPLWREPSFPVGSEPASSSKCPKEESEEDGSKVLGSKDIPAEVHPQAEVRTEDVEEECEGAKRSLTVDTTCVVVKMEQIPSPKKEHVHYFDTVPHPEHSEDVQSAFSHECFQSNIQPDRGGRTEQNAELDPPFDTEKPDAEPDSDILDKVEPEQRTISDPCASPSVPDRETLAQRAERILGIPLNESVSEQQPEDAASLKNESFFEVNGSGSSVEEENSQNQLEFDQTRFLPENVEAQNAADVKGGPDSSVPSETPIGASDEDDDPKNEAGSDEHANEQRENGSTPLEDNASPPHLSPSTDSWPSPSPDSQGPVLPPPPVSSSSDPAPILEHPESQCNDLELTAPTAAPANVFSAQSPSQQSAALPSQDPQGAATDELENQTQPVISVLDLGEDGKTPRLTNGEISEEFEEAPVDEPEELVFQQQDEISEPAQVNGVRETNLEDEHETEEGEVLVGAGVEETESSALVTQNLSQDEESVCTAESPRTEEQLSEDTEEEHAEQIQPLDESEKDIIHAASLQPAGLCTDDMEPLKEVESGLLEETTSPENKHQPIQSQEILILQPCDTEDASILKEITEEPSEGATGDPASLPEQDMGYRNTSEALTDTEKQKELDPSNSPSDVVILPLPELPAPSHGSDKDVAPSVTTDPSSDAADAVTIETDISPLCRASGEKSQNLSSSSDLLPVPPTCFLPSPLQEGNESVPSVLPLSEEPHYPKSLWDAVNRIRKHTAPDSENEEEEVSEMWDPENAGEDSGGLHGAQDTKAEMKEVPADQSVEDAKAKQAQQDPGDVDEGQLSYTSTSSHSSREMATDKEVDNGDTSSKTGTELWTLEDEELETEVGEQSCIVEDREEDQEDQDHQ